MKNYDFKKQAKSPKIAVNSGLEKIIAIVRNCRKMGVNGGNEKLSLLSKSVRKLCKTVVSKKGRNCPKVSLFLCLKFCIISVIISSQAMQNVVELEQQQKKSGSLAGSSS